MLDPSELNRRLEEAEEDLLKQVDSFRRKYNSLYPGGPLLLFTTRNESEKVVSSCPRDMRGLVSSVFGVFTCFRLSLKRYLGILLGGVCL